MYYNNMDLDSLKYADLRSLAKELGLKANGKADKLLKMIRHHYEQEGKLQAVEAQDNAKVQEEDKNQVSEDSVQDSEDAVCKDESSNINMFVTTRRGKENASRRKLADLAADCDAKMTPKDDEKVDAQSKPCSTQGKKKRKLSSDKDFEKTRFESQESGSDQQPSYTRDEAPAREKGPKVLKVGRLPRYQRLQQKSMANTQNFKKIHEAQFNKMESIDTYVQRKTKIKETNRNSVKDLKEQSDKQKPEVEAGVKTNLNRASMFSPVPVNKKTAEEKGQQALQNKTAGKDVSFRSSVLFTRRTNVRFSEATCDNEFKGSLTKTPARMSPYITSITPQKQTAEFEMRDSVRMSAFSDQKTQEKGPKVLKVGRLPRYQRLQQKSMANTPNFKKIHEAQFNKMESIDTYVQRKTKTKETNRNSVKDLKELSDKQKPEVEAGVKQIAELGKCNNVRISTVSAQKTPGPFIFTGNTSTLGPHGTQKKMTFDLKASLSRPITYKPHKGKLKPFGEVKENTSANKSLVSNTHQEIYKQHKVQSREDRRIKQMEDRKQKKENLLGARRGLVMK